MEKKMTKKEYFVELKGIVKGTEREVELTEFLDRQIELLNKKGKSTNSKKAQEVAEMTEKVYNAVVEMNRPATATEIGEKAGVSNQRASAYLKKLVEAGKVEKTEDKKKSYFSAAE